MKFKFTLLAAVAMSVAPRAYADNTTMSLEDALGKLDHNDDAHWTANGEPRIDVLKNMTGDQTINREKVDAAKPGFNREKAGGENRTGGGTPTQDGQSQDEQSPMDKALADGWAPHPDAEGYHYKDQDVKTDAEVGAMYGGPAVEGGQSAPSGGAQKADEPSDSAQNLATGISQQTGMGGATTARSPEPVEGELRKTHVSEPSEGQPGERPIGMTQGMTDQGENMLGTPEGTVVNPARDIELSGEVAARQAGSVLDPAQAPAKGSNAEGMSLGGAADPLVEARAPGGAVVAEGAPAATFFEGETAGGPFGSSGITAGSGPGQTQLGSVDQDFEGDPDEVEALENQLESQTEKTAGLQSEIDALSGELHQSLRTEAALRRRIEANRPRDGNMTTIQTYLRNAHELRAQEAEAERNK